MHLVTFKTHVISATVKDLCIAGDLICTDTKVFEVFQRIDLTLMNLKSKELN